MHGEFIVMQGDEVVYEATVKDASRCVPYLWSSFKLIIDGIL